MKKFKLLISIFIIGNMILYANEATKDASSPKSEKIIGKNHPIIKNGIMTPEVLYSFGRIGDLSVSPNKEKIVYQVTYVNATLNKSHSELFIVNKDGSDKKQLTVSEVNESNPQWINNGEKIAFLRDTEGVSQIWTMDPDGTNSTQLSSLKEDIDGFIFSPDNKKVLFIKNVKYGKRASDYYKDLDKTSGRIIDDLMYKHWDQWVEEIPHPFVADIKNGKLTNIVDILKNEPYESPMLPFGGTEQLAWSPDSKTIAYTCRKKEGKEYSLSTNSDIYLYDLKSKKTKNITKGMMGYDTNPSFSKDGKKIAWLSMERDGYESDKNRLFVMDLSSKNKKYITADFDYNVNDFTWNTDNKTIYFTSCIEAKTQLLSVNTNNKEIKHITSGYHDYASVALGLNNQLIAKRHSLSSPDEIYSVDINSGQANNISLENKDILSKLKMGKVEERWIKTTDNKKMLTWVIYPPNFNPKKKYPALLFCQGGPQDPVSQFWSYRWNLQLMAANGYIVIAPNRRGLPSFGKEWNEQISGDYGGQNMKDYFSATDNLAKEPFVNENKIGATGASYGGFSVYWLAGHHNKKFKAFLAHAGIFNLEAQYLETEEMWFANWDIGGPYWDKSNKISQRTFSNSPHKFIEKWDTPIMVSVGEKDYRILASQGMMAFNAAKLRNIPARLLVFPDENHWIRKPQNGILFQKEFFRWFDTWLKDKK